jgi:hypothetical protein
MTPTGLPQPRRHSWMMADSQPVQDCQPDPAG